MIKNFFTSLIHELKTEGKKHWKLIAFGIFTGLFIAHIFSWKHDHDSHTGLATENGRQEKKIHYWTCSMHPQIKLPKKGLCPICAMDLIPAYENESGSNESAEVSLTLNAAAQKLAEIETTKAAYQEVSNEVKLVGKVDYDETRLSYISAWIPGRIDRLFVDFTGTKVRKGDHLTELYSPDLLSAQEEYLQAIKNVNDSQKSQLGVIRDTAKTTLHSSKEKLRLYGISEKQIDDIVTRGTPDTHMTITSPVTGTVIHKNGFEGMYVKTGDRIYTIADLGKVWLFLDAYESDIQWLHYGQHVKVEAESFPGEIFDGKIAFIEPFVDQKTHTIKIRVNVDNTNEKLKPGMFVRATIHAVLSERGKVYEEDLAGKWICPMHPDIIKDTQMPCDACGMDLIKTSEFGFAEKPPARKQVLVIPKTAPLITGKRAVVYIENETGTDTLKRYVGREIILGPRAGNYYIVLSGLQEGERVVTNGNFKIDSALQIQAKPSMMNPAGYYNKNENILKTTAGALDENIDFLTKALPYYVLASKALSNDDPHTAALNLKKLREQLTQIIESTTLQENTGGLIEEINQLKIGLDNIERNLGSLRIQFSALSNKLKKIFETYTYTAAPSVYLMFCPMAFNNTGGYWLHDSKDVQNPYFGQKMLTCGEIKKTWENNIDAHDKLLN